MPRAAASSSSSGSLTLNGVTVNNPLGGVSIASDQAQGGFFGFTGDSRINRYFGGMSSTLAGAEVQGRTDQSGPAPALLRRRAFPKSNGHDGSGLKPPAASSSSWEPAASRHS